MKAGGAKLPGHALDGHDIMPFLKGETNKSPRNEYAYISGSTLRAMRAGDWKLVLARDGTTELFNLQPDPSERYNRADEKHEIAHGIYKRMLEFAGESGINIAESNIKLD